MESGNSRGDTGRGRFIPEELIAAARESDVWECDEARRERVICRIMEKVKERRERRLMVRAFAAGATAVLVAGLLLRLTGVEVLGPTRSPVAVGEQAVADRPAP